MKENVQMKKTGKLASFFENSADCYRTNHCKGCVENTVAQWIAVMGSSSPPIVALGTTATILRDGWLSWLS